MANPNQNETTESANVYQARQIRLSRKEKLSAMMEFYGLSKAEAIAQLKDMGDYDDD